ncbi:hypothetical protein BDDG_12193 [Blastomyces dermatitidis ATCC 18188]|uniref:Uncharacterized protein n=1 Tax=Ajellomyces dermatitidis (strain ATCC 18188 / CBS 674.68) TaxID=653446 RepID=A0A0J9HEW6_AJEDA|nr:hypothetical protein BDDG_12193 [Blastomyces dermatitidis ATCC 18188]
MGSFDSNYSQKAITRFAYLQQSSTRGCKIPHTPELPSQITTKRSHSLTDSTDSRNGPLDDLFNLIDCLLGSTASFLPEAAIHARVFRNTLPSLFLPLFFPRAKSRKEKTRIGLRLT